VVACSEPATGESDAGIDAVIDAVPVAPCESELEGPGRAVTGPCTVLFYDTRRECAVYGRVTFAFDAEARETTYEAEGRCSLRELANGQPRAPAPIVGRECGDDLPAVARRVTGYNVDGEISRIEVDPEFVHSGDEPFPLGRQLPGYGAVDFSYEGGRRVGAVTDTGFTATFVRDGEGSLLRVETVDTATGEAFMHASYEYDELERETRQEIGSEDEPSGAWTTYESTFDTSGRLSEIAGKAFEWDSTRSYEYDPASGRLIHTSYVEVDPGPTYELDVRYWYRADGSLELVSEVFGWMGSDGSAVPDAIMTTRCDEHGNPLTSDITEGDVTIAVLAYNYDCWE